MQFLFLLLHPSFRGYRANKASTASNQGSRQPCSATEGLQEKRLPPLQDKQHPPTATTALGWLQRASLKRPETKTWSNRCKNWLQQQAWIPGSTFLSLEHVSSRTEMSSSAHWWKCHRDVVQNCRNGQVPAWQEGIDSPCTDIQTSILLQAAAWISNSLVKCYYNKHPKLQFFQLRLTDILATRRRPEAAH